MSQPDSAVPPLNLRRIDAAALALVDRDGLAALSMRNLGAELGVAGMALYRHVPSKAVLLDRVAALILSECAVPVPADGQWRAGLLAFGAALRATLLAHPKAVPLVATRPTDPATGERLLRPLLPSLVGAGFDEPTAALAVQSVAVFVIGHALAQAGPEGVDLPESGSDGYYDAWFELGLRALVAGLAPALQ